MIAEEALQVNFRVQYVELAEGRIFRTQLRKNDHKELEATFILPL